MHVGRVHSKNKLNEKKKKLHISPHGHENHHDPATAVNSRRDATRQLPRVSLTSSASFCRPRVSLESATYSSRNQQSTNCKPPIGTTQQTDGQTNKKKYLVYRSPHPPPPLFANHSFLLLLPCEATKTGLGGFAPSHCWPRCDEAFAQHLMRATTGAGCNQPEGCVRKDSSPNGQAPGHQSAERRLPVRGAVEASEGTDSTIVPSENR